MKYFSGMHEDLLKVEQIVYNNIMLEYSSAHRVLMPQTWNGEISY
jgi:hypothetical protein